VSKLNTTIHRPKVFTHEGAVAYGHLTAEQQLRRSVLSCLLWENEFYEDGQSIAQRIAETAERVSVEVLAALAIEARQQFNLRHVPLLLCAALAKRGSGSKLVSATLEAVISRADELAEFVQVYLKYNGQTYDRVVLSAQVKLGLGRAFGRFDAYQLGKYNRDGAIKLKDVLFLSHAKPRDEEQAALWKRLIEGTLEAPDTWEVALSGGADKKATFERLLREQRLGYLALLRNLRNMASAGVDESLVREAIAARRGASRVLPFRFVAAARACPRFEPDLDRALVAGIAEAPELPGRTIVLVDVSGSMWHPLSAKSDLMRMDAAAALAALLPGERRVFTFSNDIREVPPRAGMAGVDAILGSQPHGGTYLGKAVAVANGIAAQSGYDRLIVITDEQSQDRVPDPVFKHAYMVNVASARNGIGYGKQWVHLDGFSERIFTFIREHEAASQE